MSKLEPNQVIYGLRMDAGDEIPKDVALKLADRLERMYPRDNPTQGRRGVTSKWTKVAPNLWQNGKRHIESLGGGYYELSVSGMRFKTVKSDLAMVKRDWMWESTHESGRTWKPDPDELRQMHYQRLRPLIPKLNPVGNDEAVYEAVAKAGPGIVRQGIVDWLDRQPFTGTLWKRSDVSAALARLQREGRVYSHDGGGSLTVWGGIKKGQYWSTREQVKRVYGYSDAEMPVGKTRKSNPTGKGKSFKVGEKQASALQIYVFDPAFDDSPAFEGDYERFPGSWDDATSTLHVEPGMEQAAARRLTAAANSADDDKDNELRDALTSLAARVTKTKTTKPKKVVKGDAKATYEAAYADWQAARARLGEGTVESREAMQAAHRRLYEASAAYKGNRKDNPADAYKVLFKHVEAWADTTSHDDVVPSFLLYSQGYVWQLFVGPCCLEDRAEDFSRFSLLEYIGSPDEVEAGLKKARGLKLVGKVSLIPSSKQLAEWYGGWANSGFDQIYEGEDVVDLENALEADMDKKGLEASLDKDDRKMGLR